MATEGPDLAVNGWNAEYLDRLYAQWRRDPQSLQPQWQGFFRGFELAQGGAEQPAAPGAPPSAADLAHTLQGRVDQLIAQYRATGHLAADVDPLGTVRTRPENLSLPSVGLDESHLDQRFDPLTLPLANPAKLREIISVLEDTYCRHVGVEFMHVQSREQQRWLQDRMEPMRNSPTLSQDMRLRILRELVEADSLETFLDVRYRGKKRFSLEGGESLIPVLNEIIDLCPTFGIEELTIGMPHRGRLNVLVNILEKSYDQLFSEFEESWVEDFVEGGGDVKYHRGYSATKITASGAEVRLTLSPNPSHLEHVGPVVLGRARAKQRLRGDVKRERCVPILIHGDASFPAQGIVAETLNMTHLDGYTVGGTVHIVVNNQVGFTTNPHDAHSGTYCTDIAKMVEAPIFHVNGDDPEACVFASRLALAYRHRFKSDVVVDLWCYRRYGHNEGDDPTFTQPLLYERIRRQEPITRRYAARLIADGVIGEEQFQSMVARLKEDLDSAQTRSRQKPVASTVSAFRTAWAGLTEAYNDNPVETGVDLAALQRASAALGRGPGGFNLHERLGKLLEYRGRAVERDEPIDWGLAEMLAYATLLMEGHAVRLTGQDVERGTFSHRHAVLVDQKDGTPYEPLNHLGPGQARFCVHNSPLTESACVAFEYGYSLGDPNMLIVWEAQFGDFCNGAQVIFDQFIASAETKWKRCTGLTVFLPHGYEGAGPEHSSARLERFLALCARNNMQVVYPTTPAQQFHLMRRQLKRSFRKPLVVMTPKSLLRLPAATSRVKDLVSGRFQGLLDDASVSDPGRIARVLLCSGKIYYDLVAHREKARRDDVAIVRIEQLYPLHLESLKRVLARYDGAEPVWVQEEPMNMGAWRYIEDRLRELLALSLPYCGRPENSTPAVASEKIHRQEQERILVEAIGASGPASAAKADEEAGATA